MICIKCERDKVKRFIDRYPNAFKSSKIAVWLCLDCDKVVE